jgi:hypothetical protein
VDLRPPPALQGFVNRNIQRPTRLAKGLHDEREQLPTGLQRRPTSTVEHLMKDAEMRILLMAGVPQSRRYRAAAAGEQGSLQQGQHFLPGRGSK